MHYHPIILCVLLLTFLPSCSRPSHPLSTTRGVGIGDGSLVVEMWASEDCVRPGDTVKLRATVTNTSSKTQVIELHDKPVLDLVIDFNKSTRIGMRRWSDGKPLTPDLTQLELTPGASKSIEMDWVVDEGKTGPVGINAQFIYSDRVSVVPGILVNVSICSGPLGP